MCQCVRWYEEVIENDIDIDSIIVCVIFAIN
jgi:hypothetical protein